MFDLPSKSDIEKVSMDVLKQSRALDVYPTPVDRIVETADLMFDDSIDLFRDKETFLDKLSGKVRHGYKSFVKEVRGFLDRKEKTIYIDLNQPISRQNFVKLHETGHDLLPWQKVVLEHLDSDETLCFDTKEEFEKEANYFASLTLFQHDRFDSAMDELDLSIKAGMALSKKFGGSVHASLRRMVERSDKRCALLVLKRPEEAPYNKVDKRDLFHSARFARDLGHLELPEQFDFSWEFGKDFILKKKFHDDGEVELDTKSGKTIFQYHYFHNGHNGFVFLFPKGEKKRSRVKYMIQGAG